MKIINSKEEYNNLMKENQSVLIDFYADWCGPCKMVGPLVEQLSEKHSDVAIVKVNVDNNPEIAQIYGVMSIPTLVAIKNGNVVKQTVGFMPMESLEELVALTK